MCFFLTFETVHLGNVQDLITSVDPPMIYIANVSGFYREAFKMMHIFRFSMKYFTNAGNYSLFGGKKAVLGYLLAGI